MLKNILWIKTVANQLHQLASSLSRRKKRGFLMGLDITLFLVSVYSALCFRFDTPVPAEQIWQYGWLIISLIVIKTSVFRILGIYRPVLRYTGNEFLLRASKAVILSSGILVVITYLLRSGQLPRSVLINDAFLTLLLVVSVRLWIRYFAYHLKTFVELPNQKVERIIIYGAGAAGSEIAQALASNSAYQIVAFVDDNLALRYQIVQGIPVYLPSDLATIQLKKGFDAVLLAMPTVDGLRRQEIIRNLQTLQLKVKTVPSITEILSGHISISKIREVDIADLLGRKQIPPDSKLLQMDITDKFVLVTGAGGSIGSELCRQIAKQKPACLILYELNEFALYSIDMELGETHPTLNKVACLGSVTDEDYLKDILRQYSVDTIYHAAAYKHVPLVEANINKGILNNVLGTLITARSAIECSVSKFVLISTDKAVRPTNIMGATKRAAELILQALADESKGSTCLTMVRFGNVLGSSGSVVPRFRKQIAEGNPITVTHPDMTRYFMSIPEAASLVIQAGAMSQGGEVFLLDMGEPVRIYDLAVQMIRLSGLEPDKDIEIKFTGLRPGEKIYEELLIDCSQARPTQHPKVFCAYEAKMDWKTLQAHLNSLFICAQENRPRASLLELQRIVPEYCPNLKQVAPSKTVLS